MKPSQSEAIPFTGSHAHHKTAPPSEATTLSWLTTPLPDDTPASWLHSLRDGVPPSLRTNSSWPLPFSLLISSRCQLSDSQVLRGWGWGFWVFSVTLAETGTRKSCSGVWHTRVLHGNGQSLWCVYILAVCQKAHRHEIITTISQNIYFSCQHFCYLPVMCYM